MNCARSFIMNGSRIWLDLSSVFTCVQKQSCIFLDHEKLKTVKDVEEHIRQVFGVVARFHILNDGWLLPSCESSLLLRDNDTVSVVPEGDIKVSQSVNATKTVAAESETVKTSSTIKGPHNPVLTIGNGLRENTSIPLKNPFASPSSIDTSPVENNHLTNEQLSTAPNQDEDIDPSSDISPGERKRKRIRRRKKKSVPDIDVESKQKESRPSHYQTNKLLQGVSHILNTALLDSKRKHTFFNEESANKKNSLETQAPLKPVVTEESLPIKSSCGGLPVGPSLNASPARAEENLSKLLSLGNQKSPVVFERKKPEIVKNSETNATVVAPKIPIMKLTPLHTLPVRQTLMQFKVLKMCNYSPVVSETITARVISADFPNNQIFVQIQEGLSELKTEKGKFSLELEDEENNETPPSDYILLDWKELLEPHAVEFC